MSNKLPYFPLYAKDFVSDGVVEAMTTEEVGAYTLLLCKAWCEEKVGSIPADDGVLARWARLSPEAWSGCKQNVLKAFTLREDGRLYQKRLTEEFAKSRATTRRKSEAAKLAADARWKKRERNPKPVTRLDADALPTHSERNTNGLRNDAISESESDIKTPPNPPAGGTGVRRGGEGRGGRVRGPLADVTEADLRDTGRLRERIVALVADGTIPDTENDRTMCVAAAERALEKADNPVAMWINLVRTKRWNVISADELDRAKSRIYAWLRANRPPMPDVVQGLGDRLAESADGPTDNQIPDDSLPPEVTE